MSVMPVPPAYDPQAQPVWRRPDPPRWLDEWAVFAAGLPSASLSPSLQARTRRVISDSVAAIAAGAQEPEVVALAVRLASGGTGAAVIGRGCRSDVSVAALLNGISGTMLELDEGNQYARGHPGIHVVPAALALGAMEGATPVELVAAIAIGYEIGARIGRACKLDPAMHPHGTWGTVGAAVSVARLGGATAAEMREVINVASSLGLTTSRRTMLEGGTVRNAFAGLSNQLGITAWRLVQAGFTGEADGVGTVYGKVIADQWTPEVMTEGLGQRWEIERNYFKRHACCRYNHGALDALGEIVGRSGGRLDPANVKRIDVSTYIWAAQLAGQEPHNMLAAKFSLPFALATTIVHGAASVPAFRAPAIADAAIRDLARRIVVIEDKSLTAKLPGLRPSRVRVELLDGSVLEAATETNRGDEEAPYADADLDAKFHDLVDPVWGATRARQILDVVATMQSGADLRTLDRLLAAPPEVTP